MELITMTFMAVRTMTREEKDFNDFTDDLLNQGYTKGYLQGRTDAINEFVAFANTMPTVEDADGYIRPMCLEEMAEQLKGGIGK